MIRIYSSRLGRRLGNVEIGVTISIVGVDVVGCAIAFFKRWPVVFLLWPIVSRASSFERARCQTQCQLFDGNKQLHLNHQLIIRYRISSMFCIYFCTCSKHPPSHELFMEESSLMTPTASRVPIPSIPPACCFPWNEHFSRHLSTCSVNTANIR